MPWRSIRTGLCALALLTELAVLTSAGRAAELVMFRREGCPYCAAWDRDVGPIYPKTDVGRRVPLLNVDVDRIGDPPVRIKSPIHYTPTFVLVDHGSEVGRIEGYPGDAFFWGLLEGLLDKLPPDSEGRPAATSAPGDRVTPTERSP